MEGVKACRVCLAVDVKMFSLQGDLGKNYKFLIGDYMVTSGNLPCYACYECTELIRKSTAFKEKCLRAQMALCDILKCNVMITEQKIKHIDRNFMKLESPLSIHLMPPQSVYQPRVEDVQITEECTDLEMVVEEDSKADGDGNDVMYDDDDDLPLKYVGKEKKVKNAKKHNRTATGKKAKLKHKLTSARIPLNKDVSTAKDDITKYFVVTKLSLDEQIAEVSKRKDSANYRDSPFKCDQCYKGFLLEDTLRNHMTRHDTSAGDVVCGVCKARFPTQRTYRMHAARHGRRYVCGACGFATVNMDQAKKHKAWHDGVTYTCQYCSVVSSKLTSFLSHVRVKHPSPWVCAVCGYSFVSARGLRVHMARMHRDRPEANSQEMDKPTADTETSRLYCSQCDVRFSSEEALKRHTVTSASHRDHLGTGCRECGEVFPSAAALRAHRRAHAHNLTARKLVARARYVPRGARGVLVRDQDQDQYPARCEHCEETIPSRSRHWRHYQRCHRDQQYPPSRSNFICEVCGKGFQVHAFLTYHLRTHSTESLFRCARCPAAFHTRSGLRTHSLGHCRVRTHLCTLCCKRFNTKLGLQQHLKSHGGADEHTLARLDEPDES